jgi:predicted choloylglycine hydrolase
MGIPAPTVFTALAADRNPAELLGHFWKSWPGYQQWYSNNESGLPTPSARQCVEQLQLHMPELLPTYLHLLESLGHEPLLPEFLALYNPPNFVAGCSQAIWNRHGQTALIRNYDFPQSLWSALQLQTNWNGTRVIAMSDCLWVVLDGMNEHGLAASLSFGGKLKVGNGFAITLALRYILEFCTTVREAEAVLARLPIAMTYNVTLLDRTGEHRIVFVGPGQSAKSTLLLCVTNHQEDNDPKSPMDILTDSKTRFRFLNRRLHDSNETLQRIQEFFLSPPLYRRALESKGWGTLYTSSYFPQNGSVTLSWPNTILEQSFSLFQDCQLKLGPPTEDQQAVS